MASNNRKLQPGQGCTFTFYLTYPPPPPPPPPQRDLSVIVSTSICIIGSVLLFLFLIVFLYLYITKSSRRRSSPSAVAPVVSSTRRREEENEEEEAGGGERDHHHFWSIATLGLHRSAIDSITVVVFKKGEGVIDGTDCSVCLSEFEEGEGVRLLPKCSHAFHVSCIDTWLLSHKNCPLCRAPVFSTEVRDKKTETNHQTESGSGSRNGNVLPRSQSDLASHCGGSEGRMETVRRSFSIGGSSLVKAEGSDDVAGRSRRQFYSSFSANFFSSSRRTRNQDSVLPS
ncbi:unnamed protein product [Brassica rapa]|uniref:RING-type E3 ubiquitin transferase n=1 Tax=Brassica campestris TaxID=3711 RepID=A0A3P6CP47_BRACM|nr:unnamed protein product [Brassica rapa]VDD20213.1 unnamed protein product [Brassica rapa]